MMKTLMIAMATAAVAVAGVSCSQHQAASPMPGKPVERGELQRCRTCGGTMGGQYIGTLKEHYTYCQEADDNLFDACPVPGT